MSKRTSCHWQPSRPIFSQFLVHLMVHRLSLSVVCQYYDRIKIITGDTMAVSKDFLSQDRQYPLHSPVNWTGHTPEALQLGSLRICKLPLCKSMLTSATYLLALLGLEMVFSSSWSITFSRPVVPWVLFPAFLEVTFSFSWSLHTSPICRTLSAVESDFATPAASSFSIHGSIPSGSVHVTCPVCVP